MSLQRNFIYNYTLLFFNYLFPIVVFPYVSRVLGVSNIGACNFVDSLINYAILFSGLGIALIGTREIAASKENPERMNVVFSSLMTINFIFCSLVLVVYWITLSCVASLAEYKELLYIGVLKILFSVFMIEWFYQGLENFKYITMRTICVKLLYVIALFLLIRNPEDLKLYYLLSTLTIVVNAIVNWRYKNNFVRFKFKQIQIGKYLKPIVTMGIFLMLVSMYSTFNVSFLGFAADDTQVGYYSTAIKIYTIVMGLYTAFSNVMMPHCCNLVAHGHHDDVFVLLRKSFEFLYALCIPVICYAVIFAPGIIRIIAGPGYEGAIVPMRIVMPLLLINGIAQILVLQTLMAYKKDKAIFINSVWGAIIGVSMNILMVGIWKWGSTGSMLVLLISETVVTLSAHYFVRKYVGPVLDYWDLCKQLIFSAPYFAGCLILALTLHNSILALIASAVFCLIYFCFYHFIFLKNSVMKTQAFQMWNGIKTSLLHK